MGKKHASQYANFGWLRACCINCIIYFTERQYVIKAFNQVVPDEVLSKYLTVFNIQEK